MRITLMLVCLLLVLSASIVGAESWTTQMRTLSTPVPYIDVVTTATNMGTFWTWTYALTPKDATDINGLTITLGATEASMVSNITGPVNWFQYVYGDTVQWRTIPSFPLFPYNPIGQNQTYTFGFDHPWGPTENHLTSAIDNYGFTGDVPGPAVPEPMGIMFSIMGLGSLAGFRRLRTK